MLLRLIGAIVLIISGILVLSANLGYLPQTIWSYILPAILIVTGIALLIRGQLESKPLDSVQTSAPVENATQATISLKHSAGKFLLHAGNDAVLLYAGTFDGGVEKNVSYADGAALVELKTPSNVWTGMSPARTRNLKWDVQLNPNLPMTIQYEGGAGETKMDLSGIRLTALAINTGASSVDALLPQPQATLRVVITSGIAPIKIRLPLQAYASIRGAIGTSALELDKTRFADRGFGIFQSEGYANAPDRIEITLQGGAGPVEIL